jgi:menaquinone-dependent protoporphyrinogen IX oxidase
METKKILVVYATNSGSTAEAAKMVGDELGKEGAPVEILPVEEVASVGAYFTVVVGAPMIMGWHRAAVRFIRKHHSELGRIPVAYFFTARSLTQLNETDFRGIPLAIDPTLAQPPRDPNHLSFRENYATVKNYLRPALNAARTVKPVSAAFFGGVLRMSGLKWWQTLFVLLVVQAKPGGEFNAPFIRAWAAGLREKLSE